MAPEVTEMDAAKKEMFEKILKNDSDGVKNILLQTKMDVDIVDENGMSPLQHACYKGNKEIVQMLLDQGADVNNCRHENNYTALHFAALSGNADLCQLLLSAGAKTHTLNSVGRTAAQLGAFVGNHKCVAVMNNFISRADVDYYTIPQGLEKEPRLPPYLAAPLHKFIMQINMHPVRVALNLQGVLFEHLDKVKRVLEMMRDREAHRAAETNEVAAFKFHYLSCVAAELLRIQLRQQQQHQQSQNAQQKEIEKKEEKTQEKTKDDDKEKKWDAVELFVKNMLKPARSGEARIAELQERFIRECVREYPYRESNLFRQMVTSLASSDCSMGLMIISAAINGQRGFNDGAVTACSTCGEENAPKKCSKCKAVQYCDRECQRLHWFLHKKECARIDSNMSAAKPGVGNSSTTNTSSSGETLNIVDRESLVNKMANIATSSD